MPSTPPNHPTARVPIMEPGDKLVVEFSDPEKVAAFFALLAKLIQEKKTVTITVE